MAFTGHAQVCGWEIPCSSQRDFSSASDQSTAKAAPHPFPPFPFLSVLFGKETCQDNVIVLSSCRKSCFLLAQSCTEVNMSMFNRFVFSSSILFI